MDESFELNFIHLNDDKSLTRPSLFPFSSSCVCVCVYVYWTYYRMYISNARWDALAKWPFIRSGAFFIVFIQTLVSLSFCKALYCGFEWRRNERVGRLPITIVSDCLYTSLMETRYWNEFQMWRTYYMYMDIRASFPITKGNVK